MSEKRGGNGGFVVGFVLGAIIGAVLALVFAPQSGQQTRGQIVDKGMELRDRARETTDEYISRGREYVEKSRGTVNEAANGQPAADGTGEAES